jgi:hypothetical protein
MPSRQTARFSALALTVALSACSSATSDSSRVATSSAASTEPPTTAGQVASDEWRKAISDVEVASDGTVYGAASLGIATLDASGAWDLIDVEGLPEGQHSGRWPGRSIDQVTIGPDGTLWVAGVATSAVDDYSFGGQIDGWSKESRHLGFIARRDCDDESCSWAVSTSDEVPGLAWGVGDIAVASDGTVYAVSATDPSLLVFDGGQWRSHRVPGLGTNVAPWSGSLAVTADGTVWAGTNDPGGGRGIYAFDGESFTHYDARDGLPSNNVFQVSAGPDGTVWVATDALYVDFETGAAGTAGGVASFDGETWTSYTTADGLLSNDAIVVAGVDGTVWAIHHEGPPYGVSHFDGSSWSAYETDTSLGGFRSAVAPDGSLWTVSQEGLIHYDGDTITVHPSPFD